MANKTKDRTRGKRSPGWRQPFHEIERLPMVNTSIKVPEALLAAGDRVRSKLFVTNRVDVLRRATALGLSIIAADEKQYQNAGSLILDDLAP